ncbi:hypothetical protein GALMADRAFT_243386, partial [Galerina marginata CBS 339.88]
MSALQRQIVQNKITRTSGTPGSEVVNLRTGATTAAKLQTRPPPLSSAFKGHIQFYGFSVNVDWVRKFTERHLGSELPNFSTTLFWFLQYLRAKSQYAEIGVKGAMIDSDTLSHATICEGLAGDAQVTIITLCAWDKASWDNRPTQAQVKIVSAIMEAEPQWFIDINTPDMYY